MDEVVDDEHATEAVDEVEEEGGHDPGHGGEALGREGGLLRFGAFREMAVDGALLNFADETEFGAVLEGEPLVFVLAFAQDGRFFRDVLGAEQPGELDEFKRALDLVGGGVAIELLGNGLARVHAGEI